MTTLSNRQYPMIKIFIDNPNSYMSVHQAQTYDQRPFRSMLIRGYIAYRPGKGFHITREGREHFKEFEGTEIKRKNPLLPLTAYFDPTAYGLEKPEKGLHRVA